MSSRVLVAGIGNVFFGDDGFGVAVARHLMAQASTRAFEPAALVVVRDIGIRGLHLAYDLVDGWDLLVAVDAIPTRGAPGSVHVIEPTADWDVLGPARDAHGMDLRSILLTAKSLGASLPAVILVGCEVDEIVEVMGLSACIERAVPGAARTVEAVVHGHLAKRKVPTVIEQPKEISP